MAGRRSLPDQAGRLHPTARDELDIPEEICERFIVVEKGRLMHVPDMTTLRREPRIVGYLGVLA